MKKRLAVPAGTAVIISQFWTAANGTGSLAAVQMTARYGRRKEKAKTMALEDYLVAVKSGPHLCSVCQYSIAACPWLHDHKPVPGWTARKTVITANKTHRKSFHITACPMYIPPPAARLEAQREEERLEAKMRRESKDQRCRKLFF